jgi:uncharacterized repeat protein (TIGR02543 family)
MKNRSLFRRRLACLAVAGALAFTSLFALPAVDIATSGGLSGAGTDIGAYAVTTSAPIPDGVYSIQGKTSGRFVAVSANTPNDGEQAVIWDWGNYADQLLWLDRQSDNTYTMRLSHNGKALDAAADGRIVQWSFHGGPIQRWYIVDCGGGWYKFISKYSGKAMDIVNNGTAAGTKLQQYSDTGADAQRFSLIPSTYSASYGNNRYVLIHNYNTWAIDRAASEALGGHLATITSAGEQAAVTALTKKVTWNPSWSWTLGAAFIGATDALSEGRWRWVTGEVFSYSNWAAARPKNDNTYNYAFLSLPDAGKWDDAVSDFKAPYYIIEYEDVNAPVKTVSLESHRYELYKPLTWKEAKAFCEKKGGHLATVTSAVENAALSTLLESSNAAGIWIGATDEGTEGTWRWVTGEKFSYSNWTTGQPDNCSNAEHYACMWQDYSGKWNDTTNDTQNYFICDYEPKAPAGSATPKPGTKLSLSFDPNFGKLKIAKSYQKKYRSYFSPAPNAKTVAYGGTYGALPAAKKQPKGYSFAGWWTAASGGAQITAAAKVAIKQNTKLYAHWKAKKIKLKFNANASNKKGVYAKKTVTYGKKCGKLPPCRDKTGRWKFMGWFTKKSGGKKLSPKAVVKITKTKTYYAHWRLK